MFRTLLLVAAFSCAGSSGSSPVDDCSTGAGCDAGQICASYFCGPPCTAGSQCAPCPHAQCVANPAGTDPCDAGVCAFYLGCNWTAGSGAVECWNGG